MAKLPNPYSCDVCGIIKGSNNHWYKGYRVRVNDLPLSVGFVVVSWEVNSFSTHFGNQPLPEPDAHLCGQEHAMQWASKTLRGQKVKDEKLVCGRCGGTRTHNLRSGETGSCEDCGFPESTRCAMCDKEIPLGEVVFVKPENVNKAMDGKDTPEEILCSACSPGRGAIGCYFTLSNSLYEGWKKVQ